MGPAAGLTVTQGMPGTPHLHSKVETIWITLVKLSLFDDVFHLLEVSLVNLPPCSSDLSLECFLLSRVEGSRYLGESITINIRDKLFLKYANNPFYNIRGRELKIINLNLKEAINYSLVLTYTADYRLISDFIFSVSSL